MKNVSFIFRFCAAALALALLIVSFSSCRKKEQDVQPDLNEEEQGVDISDRVYSLFDEAIGQYNNADVRASASSYALLKDGGGKLQGSYLQTFERLIRRTDGKTQQNVSSYYAAGLSDPASAARDDLKHFYDCYISEKYCYFSYSGGDRKITNFETDYLSQIGLYSVSALHPEKSKALQTDHDIVVTFTFSSTDCQSSQNLFITTMLIAFFKQEVDLGLSELTLKAHLNSETHRIESYSLTFQGIPMTDPSFKIYFVYSETFSDYGTTDPITVPNLTDFI